MIRHLFAVLLILISTYSKASDIKAGSYQLETRMLLPHLEEMRRTITTEITCIKKDDVKALFPILKQPGMVDCLLREDNSTDHKTHYILECPGKNAAKGTAVLKMTKQGISAEMNAKMGGKNMTFSQFSNAMRLGACSN